MRGAGGRAGQRVLIAIAPVDRVAGQRDACRRRKRERIRGAFLPCGRAEMVTSGFETVTTSGASTLAPRELMASITRLATPVRLAV